jgi:heptaprenyl diphosphate synthase
MGEADGFPRKSASGMSASDAAATARVAGYPPLGPALEQVEAVLRDAVLEPPDLLADTASHLLGAGGKRVRPALTLLCADTVTPGCEAAVEAAAAVELVHLGSLYHDDVIDEADTRRGVPTVNSKWTNTIAVLAGDFLLARASTIASSLGSEPASILAWTISQLVAGQIRELEQTANAYTTVDAYVDAIGGKTAALMGTACRLGVLVAGGSDDQCQLAADYGTELGMVFQIVDDVLDVVADEQHTGKRRGIDLTEGVYTLPTLIALDSDRSGALRGCLVPNPDPTTVERAIELIITLGGVSGAVEIAALRLARCDELLGRFPPSEARTALSKISRFILERVPAAS